MSILGLVDHSGRPLVLKTPKPESSEVETCVEEDPLHVIAARSAQQQSTKKDTNKQ